MEYMKEKRPCIDGIPLQYVCTFQYMKGKGMVYPAHYHDYIEILFGQEGMFELYLGSSYHQFGPGDMVVIPSGEVHLINSLSEEGGTYYVLRFLPELIYNGVNYSCLGFQYLFPFLTKNGCKNHIIEKEALKGTDISYLIKEIFREDDEKSYGYELAVRNHIGSVFLWVLRYWHSKGLFLPAENRVDSELAAQLEPVFSYVKENYDFPVNALEAAKLCSMSYSYFSRSFNRLFHMSFSDYVNHIRLMEAEKLLVSTALSITEIAASSGFNSTSYFIKLFHEDKHMSPKQFRKEICKDYKF